MSIDTVGIQRNTHKTSHPLRAEGDNKPLATVPKSCCVHFCTTNKLENLNLNFYFYPVEAHCSGGENTVAASYPARQQAWSLVGSKIYTSSLCL